jgi:[ribosomal protein S5]-alanine N-acetyltransferase
VLVVRQTGSVLPDELPRLLRPPVVLRAFEERDVPVVAAAARDPLIPLITTVPASGERGELLAYIERQWSRLASGQGFSFAIAASATDEAVGQIGLWTSDIAAGRATVGYWVAPGFRREGYARAALAAVTAWAFTLDEVARIQLHIDPQNEGSRRTAAACGYEREGLLRSWQRIGDERRDMEVHSVVRRGESA